jgi:hypothetical protein
MAVYICAPTGLNDEHNRNPLAYLEVSRVVDPEPSLVGRGGGVEEVVHEALLVALVRLQARGGRGTVKGTQTERRGQKVR